MNYVTTETHDMNWIWSVVENSFTDIAWALCFVAMYVYTTVLASMTTPYVFKWINIELKIKLFVNICNIYKYKLDKYN
jgi:hypothetical protein